MTGPYSHGPRRAQFWRWSSSGGNAYRVLHRLRPYCSRKSKQISDALSGVRPKNPVGPTNEARPEGSSQLEMWEG